MQQYSDCFASCKDPGSTASYIQAVRRACRNAHRCTLEMLEAWRAGGDTRKNMIRQFVDNNQDCLKCTIEMILQDTLTQSVP